MNSKLIECLEHYVVYLKADIEARDDQWAMDNDEGAASLSLDLSIQKMQTEALIRALTNVKKLDSLKANILYSSTGHKDGDGI